METLISAAGQLRRRSWRKCADIIGRTVLNFHEISCRSNFIFLAHFHSIFTLSITLMALQALFLATFQKMTPSYVTSDCVAFLALYRLYKVNKVTCDFPDAPPWFTCLSTQIENYLKLQRTTITIFQNMAPPSDHLCTLQSALDPTLPLPYKRLANSQAIQIPRIGQPSNTYSVT